MPFCQRKKTCARALDGRPRSGRWSGRWIIFPAAACGSRSGASSTVGDGHAFYGVMPAYISEPPAIGTKLVSVYHSNAAWACRRTSRPSSCSIRKPRAAGPISGRALHTEARTAAVSAPRRSTWPGPTRASYWPSSGPACKAASHIDALTRVRKFRRSARLRSRDPARVRAAARGAAAAHRREPWWASASATRRRGRDVIVS